MLQIRHINFRSYDALVIDSHNRHIHTENFTVKITVKVCSRGINRLSAIIGYSFIFHISLKCAITKFIMLKFIVAIYYEISSEIYSLKEENLILREKYL